ncbi:MAG TPA: hypothetical protein VLA48_02475 [Nitrososphaeraceae archaeon]|nr:hypothetical protein [Nitrososphaeraceae archaeon]
MKRYSYKQEDYYIQEKVKMKCPTTREWLKSIIYVQMGTNLKFCREAEEFYKLFKFEGHIKNE